MAQLHIPLLFLSQIFLIEDMENLVLVKLFIWDLFLGILLTLFFSTNFSDLISIRIAIGSGTAFLFAQLLDVQIFDKLRHKIWFAAPFTSSLIGSLVDTFLFFSIAFYGTGINWITLGIGDFIVKVLMALTMLIPFRILMSNLKDFSKNSIKPSSI